MTTQVEVVYEASSSDPDFAQVMQRCSARPDSEDDGLADLIEADGRWRLRKGRPVTLERYMTAVPRLAERSDVLDAALEVTLRGMSGSSRIASEAADELASRFPSLRQAIGEAVALNAALWSTTGFRERLTPRPALPLPCDFGPHLATGKRRYILREMLGQGSFGQVYRAEDRQLSEEGHPAIVAIKILSAAGSSEYDRNRMIEEATKARRISHPSVVQVLDRGVGDGDEDFIVYEFVGGGDLSTRIAGSLPMPPDDAALLMSEIARGVHAAHAAGVIHCDLKPSNVMLTPEGRPKVADFGIAVRVGEDRRAELAGLKYGRGPVGNIAFISPEQFRNDDAGFSVPSDVYALGGMLFHLLTGSLPNGSTRDEISRTHDAARGRTRSPSPGDERSGIDRDLDAICRRALAPRPDDRQASAAALAEDLERWRAREPIAWLHPSPVRRFALWARRKPALAIATSLIVVVAVAGLLAASHYAREADRKAAEAKQKSLEAQIAQMKVDEEAKMEAERLRLRSLLGTSLTQLKGDRRFLTDMLMQVWVYEFIYGPRALGDPLSAKQMWTTRVTATREMLRENEAQGAGETLESVLWRYALAFWLVSDHDHAEATPLIERVELAFRRMLDASDPWLRETHMLRVCAEVNRLLAARPASDSEAAERKAHLLSIERSLREGVDAIAAERPRSPLHYLVLNRLADVCGPNALDQPDDAASLRVHISELLDATQNKELGMTRSPTFVQPTSAPYSSPQP